MLNEFLKFIHASFYQFIHVLEVITIWTILIFLIICVDTLITSSFVDESFVMQGHLRASQISLIYILQSKSSGTLKVLIIIFKIVTNSHAMFFGSAVWVLSIVFWQVWIIDVLL